MLKGLEGMSNWVLNGRSVNSNFVPKGKGYVIPVETIWKTDVDYMIGNAKTLDDLTKIGDKIAEAKDRGYNVDLFDYSFRASKKMKEAYKNQGVTD